MAKLFISLCILFTLSVHADISINNKYINSSNPQIVTSINLSKYVSVQDFFIDIDVGLSRSSGDDYLASNKILSKNTALLLYGNKLSLGWSDHNIDITTGLQPSSYGVGRIWSPLNVYQDINGLLSHYSFKFIANTSDLSQLIIELALEDNQPSLVSFKGFYFNSDIGFLIASNNNSMLSGFELEANLWDSGILGRFELANISHSTIPSYTRSMIGFDYGFQNGLIVLFELSDNSKPLNVIGFTDSSSPIIGKQWGSSLSYNFNSNLSGSITHQKGISGTNFNSSVIEISYDLDNSSIGIDYLSSTLTNDPVIQIQWSFGI